MKKSKQSKKIKCLNNGEIYESQNAAARALGLDVSAISKIIRGKLKATKGFIFELASDDEEVTYIEE